MITIIVIEDDKNLNKLVCTYLGEHGYKTIGCMTAMEAFDNLSFNGSRGFSGRQYFADSYTAGKISPGFGSFE